MIIEFTGPSGAGKTTCAEGLVKSLRQAGHKTVFIHGELQDSSLKQQLETGLPPYVLDTVQHNFKTDLYLLPWFLLFVLRYPRFSFFSCRMIMGAPVHKMSLFRSFLRKAGLHCFFKRKKYRESLVVIDEGLFHTAHNYLVGLRAPPSQKNIKAFSMLVPKADYIVLVMATENELLENLLQRGNWSARVSSKEELQRFVHNAHGAYHQFMQETALQSYLFHFESKKNDINVLAKKLLSL